MLIITVRILVYMMVNVKVPVGTPTKFEKRIKHFQAETVILCNATNWFTVLFVLRYLVNGSGGGKIPG